VTAISAKMNLGRC